MSTPDDPSGTDEVKALLGRALAGEPPLRLDRDEVFRQGRRGLRRRRLLSTGGAIAGVVAAAVGAVLLTGLVAGEPGRDVPPAASRGGHPVPPTTAYSPPSTPVRTALSPHQAVRLTSVLDASGVLAAQLKLTRADGGEVAFRAGDQAYELRTDVLSPSAEGALSVSVGRADPVTRADCAQIGDANYGCEVRTVRGVTVAVGTSTDHRTGEKRYIVVAVRADGTRVTAIATNLSDRRRAKGKGPADPLPVVDAGTLATLATIPELRFAG